jgi:hypothetical protein
MKVSGVCPNCHRPVVSKGKGECLYCGSPISPVDTGQVVAPGSGQPLAAEQLEKLAPSAPAAPPVPRATKNTVPNLYADRAAKMQAEGINPVAEFFRTAAGKALIWLSCIGAAVGGIVYLIDSQRPKNVDMSYPKETISDIAKGKAWPKDQPGSAPGGAGTETSTSAPAPAAAPVVRLDTDSQAIALLADRILASVPYGTAFPDVLPYFVLHSPPGSDVFRAASFFTPSSFEYKRTISPDFQFEGFELSATAPSGATMTASRSRKR